jgi:hypothetical protein
MHARDSTKLVLASCAPKAPVPPPSDHDLTFRAVIESVEAAPLPDRHIRLDWVVRTRVLEVITGEFHGTHFDFRVPSPSRAGLEVGATHTIHATWTGDGYLVDENQWRSAAQ